MKYLIGIIFWNILWVCCACTDENEIDNGGRTNHCNGIPLTIRTITTDFENFPSSGQHSTRASVNDKHLKTEFVDGDLIGVFAVKNGTIVDDVDNIPLVYSASTGSWNSVENGRILYWYDGVNYVAYYPYREKITIDASQDTKAIINSLIGNDKLQPAKDQSTLEQHTTSDLMIATGTPDVSNPSRIILNLLFQHQFTLLLLQPQAYIGCFAPKNAGFVYHQESRVLAIDSMTVGVNLNDVIPYQIDSLRYCAIVTPKEEAKIFGNYRTIDGRNNEETKINYSGSTITFSSGKCYTLKVISPVPGKGSTERKLRPGDFVFQNTTEKRIEVHPGDDLLEDDGKIYDYQNAIGMVITCEPTKMTDPKCNEKGWNHAYVMGLDNVRTVCWGEENKLEKDITPMTKEDNIEDNMNGYSETEQLLENNVDVSDDKYVFTAIKKYRDKTGLPDGLNRSPWFVPSIGQWVDMLVNICGKSPRTFRHNTGNGLNDTGWGKETYGKLTKQLSKVGSLLPEFTPDRRLGFSCSSQYDKDKNWMLLWHFDDPDYPTWDRICLQGYKKSASWHLRPFFAF